MKKDKVNIKGELTKAELQLMQYLWRREKAFVNDLVTDYPDPKPAYNTVSTIVRILEKKGFVSHKSYGKTHEYYPIVVKEEYLNGYMNNVLNTFFSNSVSNMVSFFTKKESVSKDELEELKRILNDLDKN